MEEVAERPQSWDSCAKLIHAPPFGSSNNHGCDDSHDRYDLVASASHEARQYPFSNLTPFQTQLHFGISMALWIVRVLLPHETVWPTQKQ